MQFSGAAWIWSHLSFTACPNNSYKVMVNSYVMNTPLDHPVPFAGGKLYCKILSPAKVLDWMYTDALRHSLERNFDNLVVPTPTAQQGIPSLATNSTVVYF